MSLTLVLSVFMASINSNQFAVTNAMSSARDIAAKEVSHLADKKMKSLLNMAALSAKKNDKEISDYYKRKTAEGKILCW